MTILEALRRLRDDLKEWSINNFNMKLNKNLGADNGNKFLITDNDGDITTVDIVATKEELDYVAGATSNIQAQLDGKASSSHTHTVADVNNLQNTLDNIQDNLDNKSDIGHTHTVTNISDLRATATELNYMSGTTSNVQAQFDRIDGIKANKTTTDGIQGQVNNISNTLNNLPYAASNSVGGVANSTYTTTPVATSGDGATYTATVQGIDALVTGVSFVMVPNVVSTTTAPKLNVNNLGAKTIRRRVSNATTSTSAGYNASWLAANKPIRVEFDGSFWIADLPKPSAADMSGTLGVKNGGTGKTSVTAGNFLVGNGTSAMTEKTPAQVLSTIGAAPAYTYGTDDLVAGTSELATGTLYFVYKR